MFQSRDFTLSFGRDTNWLQAVVADTNWRDTNWLAAALAPDTNW